MGEELDHWDTGNTGEIEETTTAEGAGEVGEFGDEGELAEIEAEEIAAAESAEGNAEETQGEVESESVSAVSPVARLVKINVPLSAAASGYMPGRANVRTGKHAGVLNRLRDALSSGGYTLRDGGTIATAERAIEWLLEQIDDAARD